MRKAGVPHRYYLYNEHGHRVKSPGDCRRLNGVLFMVRRADLFTWPASRRNASVTVDVYEHDAALEFYSLLALSTRPRVFLVEGFLSERELEVMKGLVAQKEKQEKHKEKDKEKKEQEKKEQEEKEEEEKEVKDKEKEKTGQTEKIDSSEPARFLLHHNESFLFSRLDHRLTELLRIPEPLIKDAGSWEVKKYSEGQGEEPHYDYWDSELPDGSRWRKFNRTLFVTATLYLEEPLEGGEASFPLIGKDSPDLQKADVCGENTKFRPQPGSSSFSSLPFAFLLLLFAFCLILLLLVPLTFRLFSSSKPSYFPLQPGPNRQHRGSQRPLGA